MNNKFILFMLILSLLFILQNCATMIGYSIGKNIDDKSISPARVKIPETISDSTNVDSTNVKAANAATKKSRKTYFRVFGAGVGFTIDLAVVLIILIKSNPISPGIKF